MMQLVVFILAIVLVYAIKAVAIARSHDELAANDASFSWMSLRQEDAETAAAWKEAEAASEQRRQAASRPAINLRHVGA